MCIKSNSIRNNPTTIEELAWIDINTPMIQADSMILSDDDQYSSLGGDDSSIDDHLSVAESNNTPVTKSKRPKTLERRLHDSKPHRHLITQHNYHDHASDPIVSMGNSSDFRKKNHSTSSLIPPFPTKLYEMIEQMEVDGLSHVVSWQPHGRCFKVHQMSTFKLLLQNHFKLSKLASFQRQLNLYGFQRLTVGVDKGSYYHELFLRNRPDLASQIERVKVKGTGVRAKANPNDEPNFYLYPPVGLPPSTLVTPVDGQQAHIQSTKAIQSFAKGFDSDLSLFSNVTDTDNNKHSFTSPDSCSVVNGLMHNLSSLHFRSCDNNLSLHETIKIDMRNATFSEPNMLRNVSSCVLANNNDQPYKSLFSQNTTQSFPLSGLVRNRNISEFNSILDTSGIGREASRAVENLFVIQDDDYDSDVSFDKLIDEMFQHNQELPFPDLVQLATEPESLQFTNAITTHRHSM